MRNITTMSAVSLIAGRYTVSCPPPGLSNARPKEFRDGQSNSRSGIGSAVVYRTRRVSLSIEFLARIGGHERRRRIPKHGTSQFSRRHIKYIRHGSDLYRTDDAFKINIDVVVIQ